MRIVGGMWRGRPIEAPKGSDQTRPTTDRTRESLASMILSERNLSLEDDTVLDAFAGSGAMAFELLSRGAKHATLVDVSRPAVRTIQQNARTLKAEALTCVIAADICRIAGTPALKGAPFDIVFLDPPYALAAEDVSKMVAQLIEAGQLAEDAIVVYERSADAAGLDVPALALAKTKKLGSTAVDLYRYGEQDG